MPIGESRLPNTLKANRVCLFGLLLIMTADIMDDYLQAKIWQWRETKDKEWKEMQEIQILVQS